MPSPSPSALSDRTGEAVMALVRKAEVTGSAMDLAIVLLCAVRYALGRKTYVAEIVPRIAADNLCVLSRSHLSELAMEVRTALSSGVYSSSMFAIERLAWQRLLESVERRIEELAKEPQTP